MPIRPIRPVRAARRLAGGPVAGCVLVLAIVLGASACMPVAGVPEIPPTSPAASVGAWATPSGSPAPGRSPDGSPAPAGSGAAGPTPSARASWPVSSSAPAPAATGAPGGPSSSRPAAVPREALNRELERLREQFAIPGISVSIRWDDGRVWTGASGFADVAAERAVTPATGFSLASVSKTYTAAIVLRLVEEAAFGLDDRAAPLLPALPISIDPQITVRMLLQHTSGLTDFFLDPRIDRALQADPDALWTSSRSLRYLPPGLAVPGTVHRYANTNYLLLGLLVEEVTGETLADLVRTRLLDPLRLRATWTQVDETPLRPLARGYRVTGSGPDAVARAVAPATDIAPFRSVVSAAGGAGGLAGTADDAARWMAALVGGRVLEPGTLREMVRGAGAMRGPRDGIPYGLGVQIVRLEGRTAIGHSGRYLGFRSVVRYLPGEGLTIAVLTNQSAIDPVRIAGPLLRIAAAPRPQCVGCPEDR